MNPYDTKENRQREEEREKEKTLNENEEKARIIWLMSDHRGRAFIWSLLESAGVFRTSFNTNGLLMAFTEGNRNYGIRLLALIHSYCPEQYIQMMKEKHGN